ncbi:PepSY domain-containing protein [Ornithinibacillus sp. 4-3]|uniref:PepSY domain-containing protein n=1 Tax=Ornithinibacillus sp. 4-3 TaxID=3231488 RepID=A0AB39HMC2_9BACI
MNKKLGIGIGALLFAGILGFWIYTSDASQQAPELTTDKIREMVLSQYPGEITEIELDKELNKVVYEVEVISNGKEYDLTLDGNSGEVLKLKEKTVYTKENQSDDRKNDSTKEKSTNDEKNQTEQKQNENKQNNQQENTVINEEKAIEIAKSEFPGTLVSMELDRDDGRLIYEIEIVNGNEEAEIEIDAYTGEILVLDIDIDD